MVSITVSLAVLGCGTIETAQSRETDGDSFPQIIEACVKASE